MKTYAVKVREVCSEVVLIEAESEEQAIDKAQWYNEYVGFDLNKIEDYDFIPLREATAEDTEYYGVLDTEDYKEDE